MSNKIHVELNQYDSRTIKRYLIQFNNNAYENDIVIKIKYITNTEKYIIPIDLNRYCVENKIRNIINWEFMIFNNEGYINIYELKNKL